MTDKRKNNGGHKTAGRKSLGADEKMRQFSVKLTPWQAAWFKANGVKALRELIEKAINEA